MYLLINKNDVIVYISTRADLKSDGIHVGGNLVFSDKSLKIIKVDKLPSDIIPQAYCYTVLDGFYPNESHINIGNDGAINEKLDYIINKIDPMIDENRLTLEEMQKLQVSRVGAQCKKVIDNGTDVVLSDEKIERFSLTMDDQNNINKLVIKIKEGMKFAPYHSDTTQCKIYSAEDIMRISIETDMFILYHTTYCNSLNTWIRRCEDKEDVKQIHFGMDLPEDLKDDLDGIMELVSDELYRVQEL